MSPMSQRSSSSAVLPGSDISVRELRNQERDRWDAFAASHPASNLYHTTLWRDFVQSAYLHRPIYLFTEREGRISGILPMFHVRVPLVGSKIISLPYDIGSGGALAPDEASGKALIEAAVARARQLGVDYLELRYSETQADAAALGLSASEPVLISELELDEPEQVWARLNRKHWRSIGTARQRGVEIREAACLEEFFLFHRVMLRVFRDFGTPPNGSAYFRALWEILHPSGAVRVLLAWSGDQCVGGALLFCRGKVMINKLCLAVPEAANLRANAALYGRMIELGLELGFEKLNLGTSARSQTGLIEFKERWGASSRPAVLYSLPIRGKVPPIEQYYDSEGIQRRVWRKLPLPLTRLGASLYRWYC